MRGRRAAAHKQHCAASVGVLLPYLVGSAFCFVAAYAELQGGQEWEPEECERSRPETAGAAAGVAAAMLYEALAA